MIKNIHNINVNVFEKDIKKINDITNIFHNLLPIDFKKEKMNISNEKLEGFEYKTIYSLTLTTKTNKHNQLLIETIFSNLSKKDLKIIQLQKETRLNDEGYFYIRLDKSELLNNNKYLLTDSGNCFHIKIKLAAYPANKENFYKTLEEIFKTYQ
jgi:RNA binding exosome subunit